MNKHDKLKELREHVASLKLEECELHEQILGILTRMAKGKVYGDEHTDISQKRSRINALRQLASKKLQEIRHITKSLQQPLFNS
ncbi:hypothetical protein AHMF7605_10340 [Adhaeribacter arboris]|uniref:Uncharacterized protein n=1 Tax=Adhaeribacter arboris TaxID=2072846 RepID=A0A2T2YEF1_9BACT|nr:hypothetical protein [Adhaeribacter arboris]PSR53886.1 hypothetical protein AHMF7605_10340 [Adhaeribacter arboris]